MRLTNLLRLALLGAILVVGVDAFAQTSTLQGRRLFLYDGGTSTTLNRLGLSSPSSDSLTANYSLILPKTLGTEGDILFLNYQQADSAGLEFTSGDGLFWKVEGNNQVVVDGTNNLMGMLSNNPVHFVTDFTNSGEYVMTMGTDRTLGIGTAGPGSGTYQVEIQNQNAVNGLSVTAGGGNAIGLAVFATDPTSIGLSVDATDAGMLIGNGTAPVNGIEINATGVGVLIPQSGPAPAVGVSIDQSTTGLLITNTTNAIDAEGNVYINTSGTSVTEIGNTTSGGTIDLLANNNITIDVGATSNNLILENILSTNPITDLLWITAGNEVRRTPFTSTADEGIQFESGAYRLGASTDGSNPIVSSRIVRLDGGATLTFNNAAAGQSLVIDNATGNVGVNTAPDAAWELKVDHLHSGGGGAEGPLMTSSTNSTGGASAARGLMSSATTNGSFAYGVDAGATYNGVSGAFNPAIAVSGTYTHADGGGQAINAIGTQSFATAAGTGNNVGVLAYARDGAGNVGVGGVANASDVQIGAIAGQINSSSTSAGVIGVNFGVGPNDFGVIAAHQAGGIALYAVGNTELGNDNSHVHNVQGALNVNTNAAHTSATSIGNTTAGGNVTIGTSGDVILNGIAADNTLTSMLTLAGGNEVRTTSLNSVAWLVDGNTGTDGVTDIVGTTDGANLRVGTTGGAGTLTLLTNSVDHLVIDGAGAITQQASAGNVTLTGATEIQNTLDVDGGVVLGDGAGTDAITIQSTGADVTIAVPGGGSGNDLILNGVDTELLPLNLVSIAGGNVVRQTPLSGLANEGLEFDALSGDFKLGSTNPGAGNPITSGRFVNVGVGGTLTFRNNTTATQMLVLNNNGNVAISGAGAGVTTNIGHGSGGQITLTTGGTDDVVINSAEHITGNAAGDIQLNGGDDARIAAADEISLRPVSGDNTVNVLVNDAAAHNGTVTVGNTAAGGTVQLLANADITINPGAGAGDVVLPNSTTDNTTTRIVTLTAGDEVRTRDVSTIVDANQGLVYNEGPGDNDVRLGSLTAGTGSAITTNRFVNVGAGGTLTFRSGGAATQMLVLNNNGNVQMNTSGTSTTTVGHTAGGTVSVISPTVNINNTGGGDVNIGSAAADDVTIAVGAGANSDVVIVGTGGGGGSNLLGYMTDDVRFFAAGQISLRPLNEAPGSLPASGDETMDFLVNDLTGNNGTITLGNVGTGGAVGIAANADITINPGAGTGDVVLPNSTLDNTTTRIVTLTGSDEVRTRDLSTIVNANQGLVYNQTGTDYEVRLGSPTAGTGNPITSNRFVNVGGGGSLTVTNAGGTDVLLATNGADVNIQTVGSGVTNIGNNAGGGVTVASGGDINITPQGGASDLMLNNIGADNTITSILGLDGSNNVRVSDLSNLIPDAWELGGNTIGGASEIFGTLDAADIDIRTNNVSHLLISSTGAITQQASAGNVTLTGATEIQNTLDVNGNVTLGDGAGTDAIIIQSTGADVTIAVPGGASTHDLVLTGIDGDNTITSILGLDGSNNVRVSDLSNLIPDAWLLGGNTIGAASSMGANDDFAVDFIQDGETRIRLNTGLGAGVPAVAIIGDDDQNGPSLFVTHGAANTGASTAAISAGTVDAIFSTGKALAFYEGAVGGTAEAMIYGDGTMAWGNGTLARDVYLNRTTANELMVSSDGTNTGAGILRIASGNAGSPTLLASTANVQANATDVDIVGSTSVEINATGTGTTTIGSATGGAVTVTSGAPLSNVSIGAAQHVRLGTSANDEIIAEAPVALQAGVTGPINPVAPTPGTGLASFTRSYERVAVDAAAGGTEFIQLPAGAEDGQVVYLEIAHAAGGTDNLQVVNNNGAATAINAGPGQTIMAHMIYNGAAGRWTIVSITVQ